MTILRQLCKKATVYALAWKFVVNLVNGFHGLVNWPLLSCLSHFARFDVLYSVYPSSTFT
jgi:hypothetical protein